MGEQKKPMMTTLDAVDADWVKSPAQVLPTPAAVIRECVQQVRKLIAAGILRWPLREMQELDSQDSKEGLAPMVEAQGLGRSGPRFSAPNGRNGMRSPRHFPTNCLRAAAYRASAAVPAGSAAGARPSSLFYASSITSLRFPFAMNVSR